MSRSPVFLERESYRRRRFMDAARILPIVGLVLFLLPALWRREGDPNTAGEALYLFVVWGGLILGAALLARPLRRADMARNGPLPAKAAPDPDAPAAPEKAADPPTGRAP